MTNFGILKKCDFQTEKGYAYTDKSSGKYMFFHEDRKIMSDWNQENIE